MDSSHWDELRRSLLVDPAVEQQQARSRRRPQRPRSVREGPDAPAPWGVAVLTHLIGLAVLLGVALVVGFLVVLLVLGMGLSGAADDITWGRLVALAVTPLVVAVVLSVVAQARFLRHRGLGPAWLAPLVALCAGWLVGWLGQPLSLPVLVQYDVPSVVQILVLARILRPTR